MLENLEAIYERTGKILIRDMALEVAFSGESWQAICQQAEQVAGVKPGLYIRLLRRLELGMTLKKLTGAALDVSASRSAEAHEASRLRRAQPSRRVEADEKKP